MAPRLQRGTESERRGSAGRRNSQATGAPATNTTAAATTAATATPAAARTDALRAALAAALNDRKCLVAAEWLPRHGREVAVADQRLFKQTMIAPLRHLDGAKSPEVFGDVLRVEQSVTAGTKARDQMHQRDLGRVARGVEHTFSEEGATQRPAVESADQFISVVALARVALA